MKHNAIRLVEISIILMMQIFPLEFYDLTELSVCVM